MKSLLVIASLLCLSAQASTIDKEVELIRATTPIENIDHEVKALEAVELQKPINYVQSITIVDGKTQVEFAQHRRGVVQIGDKIVLTTGSDRTWLIGGQIYSQPVN